MDVERNVQPVFVDQVERELMVLEKAKELAPGDIDFSSPTELQALSAMATGLLRDLKPAPIAEATTLEEAADPLPATKSNEQDGRLHHIGQKAHQIGADIIAHLSHKKTA